MTKADWPTLRSLMPSREMVLVDWPMVKASIMHRMVWSCCSSTDASLADGGISQTIKSWRSTWSLACESQCWHTGMWLNPSPSIQWSRSRWKLIAVRPRHDIRWVSVSGWPWHSGHWVESRRVRKGLATLKLYSSKADRIGCSVLKQSKSKK